MTKKEYHQLIAKFELLGQLEDERKKTEYSDDNSFRRYLDFLDEFYMFMLKDKNVPPISEDKLNSKIMVRSILNRVSIS